MDLAGLLARRRRSGWSGGRTYSLYCNAFWIFLHGTIFYHFKRVLSFALEFGDDA
jgi:hypothetical protein